MGILPRAGVATLEMNIIQGTKIQETGFESSGNIIQIRNLFYEINIKSKGENRGSYEESEKDKKVDKWVEMREDLLTQPDRISRLPIKIC